MSRRPEFARRVGRLPLDLAAVAALDAVAAAALFVPAVRTTPIRVVVGLPFLLVLPGYALVAALFPENRFALSTDRTGGGAPGDPGVFLRHELDGIERLGLSVGASIVVVASIALGLDRSAVGLGTTSLVLSVGAFTLGVALLAVRRRERLPEDERFGRALGARLGSVRGELLSPDTRADAALNVVMAVSLLLAAGGTAYALTAGSGGEGDTELYLLSENEDGELVADSYPNTVAEARRSPLVVGLQNNEGEPTKYTVVAELHRVAGPPNATRIVAERELARYGVRVAPGESWQTRHVPRVQMRGDRLRLVYLLYRGTPPSDPSVRNADREVHLWLNGTAAASGTTTAASGATTAGNGTTTAGNGTAATRDGTAVTGDGTTAPNRDGFDRLGRWS
ncbi:DUF1616 domain-containing protein (plasmid) [Halorussus limi]|uniref:DUF1616 domain-containing protein n=1 Tax=Halorussus limi TaxID=2938695 RepID=A0A8U0HZW9_9EURY|nr:DUF1616 domain-containing protein [Halorussus limi]UPV76655.1 DUF1616 domain-containing protein [Halorussus limi]